MSTHLNKAQAACLETYAGGDFSHLLGLNSKDEVNAAIAECGDTLLKFLMIELSTSEDCDSTVTAMGRIAAAIEDLTAVKGAIDVLAEESWPTPPRGLKDLEMVQNQTEHGVVVTPNGAAPVIPKPRGLRP